MVIYPQPDQLQILIDAGLELIPLHQWDAIGQNGKPVGKAPMGSDWRNKPALTLDEATAHMAAGNNIGIRLPPWMLVVDADPRNYADNDKPLTRLADQFGDVALEKTAQTITGGGGWHIFFRLPDDVAEAVAKGERRVVNQLANYQGVEFKGFGRQVVAPGSLHPDTKDPYSLDDDTLSLDVMGILEAPAELVEAVVRGVSQRSVQSGFQFATPAQLQETLAQLDPTDFRDHDMWLEFMMSCHAATQGEGLDEFVTWSTSDPEYSGHGSIIAYRWDTLDANLPDGITHLSFRKIVQDHGGKVPIDRDDFADIDPAEDADGVDVERSWLSQLNDEYLFVDEGGTIKIYRELYDRALKRKYWARYDPRTFTLKHDDRETETPFCSSRKRMPLGAAWLKWPGRRQADGITFEPESPTGILEDGTLNLWQGFGVEPNPNGDCSLLYELISKALALGNDASEKYILDWLAYSIQRPHLPAEVAMVFRGGKGTGKGTLGRAFYKLFGRHGLHITSPTLLTGRFNSHLQDCVALFADEAFWAGDKSGESVLKGLVTEPMITYEGKGKDARMGRNCIHIIMASNSDWVVPAGVDDERRFAAFDVDPLYRNNKAFFTKLNQQLEKGGFGRLLHDLLQRDVSNFDPINDTPATKALGDQKLQGISTTHEHVFVYGVLNGDLAADSLAVVTEKDELVVPKSTFKELAEMAGRKYRYLKHSDADQISSQFFQKLNSITGMRVKQQRGHKRLQGRPWVWIFPPLDVCREMIADLLGYRLEDMPIDSKVENWGEVEKGLPEF